MTNDLEKGDAMEAPLNPEEAALPPDQNLDANTKDNNVFSTLSDSNKPENGNGTEKDLENSSVIEPSVTFEEGETKEEQIVDTGISDSKPIEEPVEAIVKETEQIKPEIKETNESVQAASTQDHITEEHAEIHSEISGDNEEHVIAEPLENYLAYNKEELVNILDDLLMEPDFSAVRNKVGAIKEAFQTLISHEKNVALAAEHEDGSEKPKEEHVRIEDPLAERFFGLMKKFNRRRIELREKADLEKTDNLKAKTEILAQLKNLIQNEENMQNAFNQFHELQAKWRAIGSTPQQNVNDLWLTYKLYVDKFYELIRINKELQELDFKKNLAAKIKICERAEELILEPSINKALNHMQSLQNQFRETGPVPRDNKNEVWERFKAASDKIFERKNQYLDEQKGKYDKSLGDKNALCEKAEELSKGTYLKSSEWQEKIKELLQLQAEWKKTGFSGKEENDKIWNRFKSAFDHFFQNKKEFYNKIKEEYTAHLQKKTELCLHAEALKDSTDWKNTANELKRLQQDWKTIGSAGEYNERKIFTRFRKACDNFFENKNKHFATQDQQQEENYLKKMQLIEQIESFSPNTNHVENVDALKGFQSQWMEMGLVPISKKDEINTRYKTAIDDQFSKLRIGDADRSKMRYTQKTDHFKSKPTGGSEKMSDEKRMLLSKITALKNDVQLWENNIGFFAKSKNADVLKKEIEDKINLAKEEIKTLNQKMELIKKE